MDFPCSLMFVSSVAGKRSRNSSCSSCRWVCVQYLQRLYFYSSCVGVGHLHKCKLGAAAPKKDKPRPLQKSILTVNHSGSDQFVSVIPGSKLSGGDATLWLVEDNVPTPFGHVQYTFLQGLAVTDSHREAGLFAGF